MAPTHTAKTPIKSTVQSKYNQKRSRDRRATITPIIKIVQVFAPTLVRTDVANFRALVQEMTGNASVSHNIKDISKASTYKTTSKLERSEAKTVSAQVGAPRREGGYCKASGGIRASVQGLGMEEKRTCAAISKEESDWNGKGGEGELGGEREMESSSWQSAVDGLFAESEEACVEDYLYKMQQQQQQPQYCSAYFTNWRQPLEIPGGFESFDYF